jgi:hypothetical protein
MNPVVRFLTPIFDWRSQMPFMKRLKAWWYRQRRRGKILTISPQSQKFPDLGPDGQVTIDCIVSATSYALPQYASVDERFDNALTGISSHCVGAMLVEVDQYGFRLRWKPVEKGENLFAPSLLRTPDSPKREQQTS